MEGTTAAANKLETGRAHVIACFGTAGAGPTLVVVGSLHGNEPSGAQALRNVAGKMQALRSQLHGRVYFLEGNVRASKANVRFIESDLNRHWTQVNIARAESNCALEQAEDHELRELHSIFKEILATADNEVFVVDLHTTSAKGLPFATVGDTLRNRHFARMFPVTILLGIEEQLQGTMLEYLNNFGAVTLGFEGGQHDSAEAIANHEALVWLALVNSGIVSPDDVPDAQIHKRNLEMSTGSAQIVEVRHREAICADDGFVMHAGFNNFDEIKKGQVLAENKRGHIKAVESGVLLMPLYQKKGEDGFFIGRRVAPFWMGLSEVLRRMKLADWMFLLPGVKRHPHDPESLIVNTAVARFFPLQIFHLLGFRRRVWQENYLVVSRRKFDTRSPFVKV